MENEIRLTSEMFLGLLQGKKLEFVINGGKKHTLYPPHYGLYLTHEQLVEIKSRAHHEGAMSTYELLEKITRL